MKKTIIYLLIAALCLGALAGCGKADPQLQETEVRETAAPEVPETRETAAVTTQPAEPPSPLLSLTPTDLSMQSMLYSGQMMAEHEGRWYSSYDAHGKTRFGYTEDQAQTWQFFLRSFANSVYVIDGRLYYSLAIGDPKGIYEAGLNNENPRCLLTRPQAGYSDSVQYWDGCFYFCNTEGDHEYLRMPIEGGEPEVVLEEPVWYPVIHDGWILYQNDPDKMSLYWARLDGSEKQKLNDTYSFHPYFDGESIYYMASDVPPVAPTHDLMVMKPDGSDPVTLIEDGVIQDLVVTEDWIFTLEGENYGELWRMTKDGKDRQRILEFPNMYSLRCVGDYILFQELTGGYLRYNYAVPQAGGSMVKLK